MKATLINGKGSASHNDRTFDTATSTDIEELIGKWQCIKGCTFDECELKAYEMLFGDWLDKKNQTYIKNRHKEKVKTMEQILGGPNLQKKRERYEPTETILQIGKDGENVPLDVLKGCLTDYLKRISSMYGKNMQLLDFAIHKENSSVYHVHLRRVWFGHDKDGNKYPCRKKALEELGYENADERFNNATITQTQDERQIWYDICHEHGLVIDDIPEKDIKHLETRDFKRAKEANNRHLQAQKSLIQANEERIAKQEERLIQNAEELRQADYKRQALHEAWYGHEESPSLDDVIGLAR